MFPFPASPREASQAAPSGKTSQLNGGFILARAFGAWRDNSASFTGLVLISMLPLMVVVFRASEEAAWGPRPSAGPTGLLAALAAVGGLIQIAGFTYGVVQHQAMRDVRFGKMLLFGLLGLLPVVPAWILVQLVLAGGLALLVIPGLVLGCGLAVALPAAVLEGGGPLRAIARSWTLTRGHRGAIFAAYFALGMITVAFSIGTFLLAAMQRSEPLVIRSLLGVFVSMSAVGNLIPVVTYHQLRVERDGVSSAAMAVDPD